MKRYLSNGRQETIIVLTSDLHKQSTSRKIDSGDRPNLTLGHLQTTVGTVGTGQFNNNNLM